MIYGVEYTTDLHHPETRIVTFPSTKAGRIRAEEWASKPADFAWPNAARNDIPGPQQNFHHRLRSIYSMPPRWKPPGKKEQAEYVAKGRGSSYYRHGIDLVARRIQQDGEALRPLDVTA